MGKKRSEEEGAAVFNAAALTWTFAGHRGAVAGPRVQHQTAIRREGLCQGRRHQARGA